MDNEGILGVDIECTECGRLMALSNAFQYNHKYLCPKCAPDLDEITSSHQIPRGATVRSKTMYEQKLEQELADLKRRTYTQAYIEELENKYGELLSLVGEFVQAEYNSDNEQMLTGERKGFWFKRQELFQQLKQAVTLAKGDSKEEK